MSQRYQSLDMGRRGHRFISRSGAFGHAPVELYVADLGGANKSVIGVRAGLNHVNRQWGTGNTATNVRVDPNGDDVLVVLNNASIAMYNRQGKLLASKASVYTSRTSEIMPNGYVAHVSWGADPVVRFYSNDLGTLHASYSYGSTMGSVSYSKVGTADLWIAGLYNTTDVLQRVTTGGSKSWGLARSTLDSYYSTTFPTSSSPGYFDLDASQNAYCLTGYRISPDYYAVFKVNASGSIVASGTLPQDRQPQRLAVAGDGSAVYVTAVYSDSGTKRVVIKLNSSLSVVSETHIPTESLQLRGIAIDPAGENVYTAQGVYPLRYSATPTLQKESGLNTGAEMTEGAIEPAFYQGAPATPHY